MENGLCCIVGARTEDSEEATATVRAEEDGGLAQGVSVGVVRGGQVPHSS